MKALSPDKGGKRKRQFYHEGKGSKTGSLIFLISEKGRK